jgi:hypothetical protein
MGGRWYKKRQIDAGDGPKALSEVGGAPEARRDRVEGPFDSPELRRRVAQGILHVRAPP